MICKKEVEKKLSQPNRNSAIALQERIRNEEELFILWMYLDI